MRVVDDGDLLIENVMRDGGGRRSARRGSYGGQRRKSAELRNGHLDLRDVRKGELRQRLGGAARKRGLVQRRGDRHDVHRDEDEDADRSPPVLQVAAAQREQSCRVRRRYSPV